MQRFLNGACQLVMKKLICFLLPLSMLAACKTELEKKPGGPASSSLVGEWELRQHFGGMIQPMSYLPGNGNLLVFDSTTYQYISNGQVVRQGQYAILVDSFVDVNSCALLPAPDDKPNRIVFDNETQVRMNFIMDGRNLKIHSGCIPLDGGGSIYFKTGGN